MSKKLFTLDVQLMFKGTVQVNAENLAEAQKIVSEGFSALLDKPHSSDNRVVDWDMDTHPEKTIGKAVKQTRSSAMEM